jgi:DNA-binding MltR family transcriptional regulator
LAWLLAKHDDAVIADIERSSDRAAAILAAACLEDRLSSILDVAFEQGKTAKKVADNLLKGYGPLGSFKAKIDLALVIGMLSEDRYANINRIRELRNLFAHSSESINFKSQKISDICKNFQKPPEYKKSNIKKSYLQRASLDKLVQLDTKAFISAFYLSASGRLDTPRNRYMFAVKESLFWLQILQNIIDLRRETVGLVLEQIRLGRDIETVKPSAYSYWPWGIINNT